MREIMRELVVSIDEDLDVSVFRIEKTKGRERRDHIFARAILFF